MNADLGQSSMNSVTVHLLVGLGLALALTPLCRLAALRLGFVARPKEDRWHRRPTALFGGVAIVVAVLGGALALGSVREVWLLALCGGLIFIVGLTDDLITLKPSTKLVAEIVIASIFLFLGYRLGWVRSLTLDSLLTLIWVVGITNALNLLDNMDGLSAGIAAIAGATVLATVVPVSGPVPGMLYVALIVGATVGFLVYNVHPASIFMGDSGSLFLGLNLAVMTLDLPGGVPGGSNILSIVAAPVLVLLIPIFDTTLVTFSRLLSGRRASQGGRDHSSHRLVAIGLPERMAVAVLWVLAALGGFISWMIQHTGTGLSGIPALLLLVGMGIFAAYLSNVRVYTDADEAQLRARKITPFVVEFMYKRRVAEVLLDVCLISVSYYAAYRLRFEGEQFGLNFQYFLHSLPLVLGLQMLTLFVVGAYRGVWRYFGLADSVTFAKGVALGTLLMLALMLYLYRFENYSRSVFVIYATLALLLLTFSRASFRLISEFARRRRQGTRLVIYGAGDSGSLAARELLNDERYRYQLLGFIDDDRSKERIRVQGYPVLGGYDSLVSLIRGGAVDAVVLSSSLIDASRVTDLERLCAENGINLLRLHFKLEQIVAS